MVTFANPIIFAALAALAVPVLLHLMRRQTARQVVFPTLRFLRRSRLPQSGRRKLRDIPLLLLRLLVFALLVAVFAKPVFTPRKALGGERGGSNLVTIVVLDDSASMRAAGVAERARAAVRTLLCVEDEQRVGLVLGTTGEPRVLPPDVSPDNLVRALEQWQPSLREGAPEAALREAAKLLPKEGEGRLVLVSDFRRNDWCPLPSIALPPTTSLRFENVVSRAPANWALLDVRPRPQGEEGIAVAVDVRSFANSAIVAEISLSAGGTVLDNVDVDVPARSVRTASLSAGAFATPVGRVDLDADGDAYAPDDRYHAWLGAPPPPQVLVCAPFADAPSTKTDVFFLRQALTVAGQGEQPAYRVESVDSQFFFALNPDPARYPVLICLGAVGRFDDEAIERLDGYLRAGGAVFVFPGAHAARGFRHLQREKLLNATYRGLVRNEPPLHPGELNGDPLEPLFSQAGTSDIFLANVSRHAQLTPGDHVANLATLTNGDPLLLRQPVGQGTLFAFATAPASNWSDLHLKLSFVPMLHELLASALPDDAQGTFDVVCGGVPTAPAELMADGETPSAEEPPETTAPGIAHWRGAPVQINVSRKESLPETASLSVLRDRLRPRQARSEGEQSPSTATAAPASGGVPLWPHLATAAAVLFLASMLLELRRG